MVKLVLLNYPTQFKLLTLVMILCASRIQAIFSARYVFYSFTFLPKCFRPDCVENIF